MIMEKNGSKKWGHDELAYDLAKHLSAAQDRMIWVDMQIGPSGSPRPDVYTAPKSYSKFRPISYECKISRTDFMSDMHNGKWQSYLKFSSGVVFAAPLGLIDKKELPKGCGLIVRSETGWRVAKAPTLELVRDFPQESWIKLLIDGVDRSFRENADRYYSQNRHYSEIEKKYGHDISKALADRDQAQRSFEIQSQEFIRQGHDLTQLKNLQRIKSQLKQEKNDLEYQRREFCSILGLPENARAIDINRAINMHKKLFQHNEAAQLFSRQLASLMSNLDRNMSDLNTLSKMALNLDIYKYKGAENLKNPDLAILQKLLEKSAT